MMKKPVYLFPSGKLSVSGNIIYLENDTIKEKIIVDNTDEIYLFGEMDLDRSLFEFIAKAKIIIHFFNRYGYYFGSFYPEKHFNAGYMTVKQVEFYMHKRLTLAKLFVEGAVNNMVQVLKYYIKRGRDLKEVEQNIMKFHKMISLCKDVKQLMAIEGNVRDWYYQAFDIILEDPDFIFEQRSRRPPKNYLNTLISFGNSMMYTTVLSEIYRTHLDPRIGYLHSTNFRRFTLNLDIAEIFKPIIVDRVIFTVINKRIITAKDFESSTRGVLLKGKGRDIFIEQYEDKLSSMISHRDLDRKVSYKRLIGLELRKLEKHLMGEEKYRPVVSRW